MENNKMDDHIIYGGPVSEVTLSNTNQSLGTYLTQACRKYKDNVFMIDAETEERITWNDVLDKSGKVSNLLLDLGCSSGSVVGVICESSLEYPSLLLGIVNVGAIYTSISSFFTANELLNVLELSKPSIIFTSRKSNEKIKDLQSKCSFLKLIVNLDEMDFGKYSSTCNNEDKINSRNTAIIVYTSGTTGLSKAVLLSHKSWIYTLEMFKTEKYISFPENNVVIALVPKAKLRELITILSCCVLGFKYVRIPSKSEMIFRYIEKFEISTIVTNPYNAAFMSLFTEIGNYDVSSVKLVFCGGEFIPFQVIETLKRRFRCDVLHRFGMCETTGTTLFTVCSSKEGITGRLMPGLKAKIVDLQNRRALGPFQKGEYCVKGPLLCNGYVNTNVEDVFDEDGFLRTGDVGYYDLDQNFYICGRLRDGFSNEGSWIFPGDLEILICQNPGVKAVAIVGVPDKLLGNANASPRAYIVKQPGSLVTEDEIMQYVACNVSHHKWLHGGVRFVDSLPRTKIGKVDRNAINQWVVNSIEI